MTREEMLAEITKLENRIVHGEEMIAVYQELGHRASALRVRLNNLGMRMKIDDLRREVNQ